MALAYQKEILPFFVSCIKKRDWSLSNSIQKVEEDVEVP